MSTPTKEQLVSIVEHIGDAVKNHSGGGEEISQAEWSEIVTPLPGNPTDLPVLFDEFGAERQVGWYRLANGTKKPVYEKNIISNDYLPSGSTTLEIPHNISNIDMFISVKSLAYQYSEGNVVDVQLLPIYNGTVSDHIGRVYVNDTNICFKCAGGWQKYKPITTLQYTKITDTPS